MKLLSLLMKNTKSTDLSVTMLSVDMPLFSFRAAAAALAILFTIGIVKVTNKTPI
jgi:hypothetical protein